MSLKILYTAFDVVPSSKGASTHITYFTQGLVNAGYEVTLITAGDPTLPECDTYYGATMLRAPLGDDPNFLKRALTFGRYVLDHVAKADPYAVVHFRSIWSGFLLTEARGRFGYKLLYEVNGLPSIEMKYHYPALRGAPVLDKLKEQELAALRLADAIICPSQVTRAYIASLGIPSLKVMVIPNGIDAQLFKPLPRPVVETLAQPTGNHLPQLLYLGTLADWQGLETLIAAMPLVLAKRAVQLRIMGRGRKRQRKMIEKQVRKLGLAEYVVVEPAVPHAEVPAIIAQADVCVAPLGYNDRNVTQGCCPIKVLEYMACGRPVVASNLPVVRELAQADVDLLLFTPEEPEDLARKILAILSDPALATQLGARAAAHVHQRFTWSAAQQQLLAVYQSMLTRSSGHIA